jgi:hypothetical protein
VPGRIIVPVGEDRLGQPLAHVLLAPGTRRAQLVDRKPLFLIDRSATAIERTRRRNPRHLASGRLAVETVDLADFDPGKAKFNKVFAVNVFCRPRRERGRGVVDPIAILLAWDRDPRRERRLRTSS